ncbi:hypothetical protein [Pseudomonas sp. S11P7]|uniref:hypothetical protein n=1 Tax=Pseudomonas sp. S11P7 TaxID=3029169 RepID=UPI00215CB3EF|nr:hypothetical protein [Pseudomonas sp. S11P7]MCR8976435.1 hypothetical protein [Pseudomonas sp. S11P7]
MNFDNVPAQMIALVFGWSFTVFCSIAPIIGAESLKRKDKVIDKLEALAGWVESEIKKDNFSSANTEITYSGMISQIEVRIAQLNYHVGKNIFDGSKLAILRDIEIHSKASFNADTPYKIREAVSDIVENIEVCCDAEYFSRKGVRARFKRGTLLLNEYVQTFKGGLLVLTIILLCLAIYQFWHKYLSRPVGTCVYGEQCHLAPGLIAPPNNSPIKFLEEQKKSLSSESAL